MAKTEENGRKAKSYRGKKRGMKPRSQRNRKKPRGGVGILTVEGATEDQDSLVKVEILPLQFPGDDTKTEKRIRVVRPYPFTFATFAKERYVGRSMLCFVIPSLRESYSNLQKLSPKDGWEGRYWKSTPRNLVAIQNLITRQPLEKAGSVSTGRYNHVIIKLRVMMS